MIKKCQKILLLEDDPNVGETLKERLQNDGFEVSLAPTLAGAKALIRSEQFDLALLDVGLPDGSGFEVAELIKAQNSRCTLIFLTAYGEPDDRIKGLELGAEDYIVKPFHYQELLLRIKNGLKRTQYILHSGHDEIILLGRAKIYFSEFRIESQESQESQGRRSMESMESPESPESESESPESPGRSKSQKSESPGRSKSQKSQGRSYSLTHKECALLKLLVDRSPHVVSRDEILDFVWSKNEYPTSRTVDNFIVRLRRFIEDDPKQPKIILNIRGIGYQIKQLGEK